MPVGSICPAHRKSLSLIPAATAETAFFDSEKNGLLRIAVLPDVLAVTHVTQPDVKSGGCPLPLSFLRKQESMFFTDSCFRRNDRCVT